VSFRARRQQTILICLIAAAKSLCTMRRTTAAGLTWFWIQVFGLALLSTGVTAQMALPRHAPYPGGVAVVKLGETDAQVLDVVYGGNRVLTIKREEGVFGIVGIPLDARPGMQKLHIAAGQGSVQLVYETGFEVKSKAYGAQHLKIAPRFLQPSVADQQRIDREQPEIDAAQKHWSDAFPSSFALDLPANGRLSGRFGERRVFNGKESVPHAGLDLAVMTGTPVRAAAAGRVISTGDYFYSGKSVFVDHGHGFITLYIHLHRIDVKAGDSLARGAALGQSGATGRVTGAHLHWGVLLNGVYVDPELFLRSGR
jgi:hypothetical protein